MDHETFVRVFTLATVIAGVTPCAIFWLFMLWQNRKGRIETPKRKGKPDEAASFEDQ